MPFTLVYIFLGHSPKVQLPFNLSSAAEQLLSVSFQEQLYVLSFAIYVSVEIFNAYMSLKAFFVLIASQIVLQYFIILVVSMRMFSKGWWLQLIH